MNICIVTPIFPPEIGGPATYSFEIAKLLRDKGHKIRIVTFTGNAQKLDGVEISTVEKASETGLLRQTSLFSSVLNSARGCDLIYAQDPAVVGFASSLAGKVLRKPVVLKFVGDIAWETAFQRRETSKFLEEFLKSPDAGPYIKNLLIVQRFVLRSADRIIVPSSYLKRIITDHYSVTPEKVRIIHNAIHMEEYEGGVGGTRNRYRIITAGRLVPWKGFDEIIKVMPQLTDKFPKLKLVIAGDGPERKNLEGLIMRLKLEDKISLRGKISHNEMKELLQTSEISVLNSKYEGLPHTILEAMASKTAVIASNIEGNKEIVKDEETGLIVNVGDEAGLRESIDRLLENDSLRKKLIENAYQQVKEDFTWDKTVQELEEVLTEVSR